MEYDSESSCGDHVRHLGTPEEIPPLKTIPLTGKYSEASTSPTLQLSPTTPAQSRLRLGAANKRLSAQVMEYYHKYSQSSNLDQYFSLPAHSTSPETVKYYYSFYEINPKLGTSRQDCIGEEYNLRSYVPKERRRWVRPPLVGQSSTTDASNPYIQPLTDPLSMSPDPKRVTPDVITQQKNENQEILQETSERKTCSPTSSIASHKPLEWDSGADVGYFNSLPSNRLSNKKLSTIERMALARGCSAALRLDPEGTTESGVSGKITIVQTSLSSSMMPNANSTPLTENPSESESELEITPIVKSHLPGSITGNHQKSNERQTSREARVTAQSSNSKEQITDTPKLSAFKVPFVKHTTDVTKIRTKQRENNENLYTSPLKKSTSMNMLTIQSTKLTLKRSQSELNLLAKDKNRAFLPLIYNSTSSIATVVNKPTTSDKVIQTSINACSQESIGVQVSALEEEKPPLPKRGSSLQKTLQSILKNPEGTYKINTKKSAQDNSRVDSIERIRNGKPKHNSTEISQNDSARHTSQADDTGNLSGRANSFEYLPGHIYENVPNGSSSRISSIDTAESNSTIPNTSSSIDEKLWGDSDSLVRDLERSVNILKSLVDANKCDKQVKKRLIHHVVKRLVTAKYTDDKIEHNLEDNVPWNPDDARKKVYRTEILQALAKKHSTTDSSDDWKPAIKNGYMKKPVQNGRGTTKESVLESSNSDKFDGHTDRTEMDGRKARMGLRTDDCQQSSNTPTDPEKSESSECFFPQRNRRSAKAKNIFCLKDKCKVPDGESTTTNSTPADHNRMLLDAVVNSRRTATESSNNTENNVDWRLPTTLSERQFELKKCSNSDSGDTKLVSYAEMEKRNQLIWITNEISHLCNLKKLLEQPRKLERPKTSPRKLKQPHFKDKQLAILTCLHDQCGDTNYSQRRTSSMRRNSITDQWSSHCNLAACRTESTQSDILPHLGKRNSCAQTATATACAHSRTGGEIVSAANTRASSAKLINIGTQTHPSFLESEYTPCSVCRVNKNPVHIENKCTAEVRKNSVESEQNVCAHCLENQNQAVNNGRQKLVDNLDYVHSEKQTSTNSENSIYLTQAPYSQRNIANGSTRFKQKDTKNEINASKSKYSQCNNDCACKVNGTEAKLPEINRLPPGTCPSCSKETQESTVLEGQSKMCRCEQSQQEILCKCEVSCICYKKNHNAVQRHFCAKAHRHSHKRLDRLDDKNSSTRSDVQYQLNDQIETTRRNAADNVKTFCRCSSNCACENKRQDESRTRKLSCDFCSEPKHRPSDDDRQPQPQFHATNGYDTQQHGVQTDTKCNCGKDCSCVNKLKAIEEQFYSTKYASKTNYTNERAPDEPGKSCRCCRTCGTPYENTKKCNCYEAYPKPVAYEISFTKGTEQKENDSSNANGLPRISLTDPSQNDTKQGDCACEKIKSFNLVTGSRKNTLQDYLSRNKPDFVDNAETRRQFMSEISHLRELRKEKRLQLLAMASTSGVLKTTKSSKPPPCTQRKITDAEMKERLRKRYYRLSEVRSKRRQQEKQEEARRNKLMAKIFCKKLQQKVLRGQVDLSQSVSVISNL